MLGRDRSSLQRQALAFAWSITGRDLSLIMDRAFLTRNVRFWECLHEQDSQNRTREKPVTFEGRQEKKEAPFNKRHHISSVIACVLSILLFCLTEKLSSINHVTLYAPYLFLSPACSSPTYLSRNPSSEAFRYNSCPASQRYDNRLN